MPNGLRYSPLRLNDGIATYDVWNEASIKDRAGKLAQRALDIWASPRLPADILDAYDTRTNSAAIAKYSISDHPSLTTGVARDLFEALRASTLALDECVYEEFQKLYVAYKAETNFVDVIPQSKRLLLSLKIDMAQLDDPRGLCRDVANIGRWGNGKVEVVLDKQEDLPYVTGLIRQALDLQLGDDE